MVEELKAYLKEAHDGIRKMYLENLSLAKEYVKSVEDNYSSVYDSFENSLWQVKHFYLGCIFHESWFVLIK